MDRPEDVQTNPVNGQVYVMLTNNSQRPADRVDRSQSPRQQQPRSCDRDYAEGCRSRLARGELDDFHRRGKPGIDSGARYHRAISENGWFLVRIIAPSTAKAGSLSPPTAPISAAGIADGIWIADTEGYGRALTRLFYQAPSGAEVCGPGADARRPHSLSCDPASRRRSRLDLRKALDTLARFQGQACHLVRQSIAIVKKDGGVIGS